MPARSPARRGRAELLGAVFLMATSAIGPGFLTQTALFTHTLRADFAFAILASLLVDVAAQLNVWLVLGVARRRGQEVASALVPGLGRCVAVAVAAGGLAFNVGNLAGCALGLAVFGLPPLAGAALSALLAFALLARPAAGRAMDLFVQALGLLMIALTGAVMLASGPDYGQAALRAVLPQRLDPLAVVTLVGGTVGGYITFAGVHRLLAAGRGGPDDAPSLRRAAVTGIVVTGVMRVLLFLAVLGVVSTPGAVLDLANPAASAFRLGAGEWGYRFFGLVLWSAAITSVVGCSYTSLSFLRDPGGLVERRPVAALALFVGLALLGYARLGQPVPLLIAAGALNGLILPITLGVALVAARRPELMGTYRHPLALQALGWLAWGVSVAAGGLALGALRKLFG